MAAFFRAQSAQNEWRGEVFQKKNILAHLIWTVTTRIGFLNKSTCPLDPSRTFETSKILAEQPTRFHYAPCQTEWHWIVLPFTVLFRQRLHSFPCARFSLEEHRRSCLTVQCVRHNRASTLVRTRAIPLIRVFGVPIAVRKVTVGWT